MPIQRLIMSVVSLFWIFQSGHAEEIGSVDTVFKLLGPNHKIVVEAFDDPKVEGVTCFLSRSKTGGIKGSLGLAEDTSDASIACRQVGPVHFKEPFDPGEVAFQERRSLVFKKLQVVRFFDKKRNTLVYLAYSDRLIEGSPKNSISAVPILTWSSATKDSHLVESDLAKTQATPNPATSE